MLKLDLLKDPEFIEALKAHATPIDFEQLEVEGLLRKKGAWYQVENIKKLPEYVGKQIIDVKDDSKGNLLVKLPKSWGKSQKMYKNATGKEYYE